MRFCESLRRVVLLSSLACATSTACVRAEGVAAATPAPTPTPAVVPEGLRLLEDALALGDPEKVVALAAPMAEAGSQEANLVMAIFEDTGAAVRIDRKRATERLVALAKQRYAPGTWFLYHRYLTDKSTFDGSTPELMELVKGMERPKEILKGLAVWLSATDAEWKPNYFMAFPWIQREAEAGNRMAIENMADVLDVDNWVHRDPAERVRWLEKLVALQDVSAKRRLGIALMSGDGVARDLKRAQLLLEEAAAAGDAKAMFAQAEGLEKGTFGAVELLRAKEAYAKAGALGHKEAFRRIVRAEWKGDLGTELNPKQAFELASMTAAGDVAELITLADFYREGVGVEKDLAHALELYEQAVERGEWSALEKVKQISEDVNVDGSLRERAKTWHMAESMKGSPQRRFDYFKTQMRYEGIGSTADMKGIFKWLEGHARRGKSFYEYHVGRCLLEGLGIEKDPEEAVYWFRLAAEKGFGSAWIALGNCARDGIGCPKDLSAAFRCYENGVLHNANDFYGTVRQVETLFRGDETELESFKQDVRQFISSESRVRQNPEFAAMIVEGLSKNLLVHSYEGAAEFFDFVCDLKNARAAERLFPYYMTGTRLPFNLERARKCMEVVAKRGSLNGKLMRAEVDLYTPGPEGESVWAKAIELLEAQNDAQRSRCRLALARAFARGIGVPKDSHRARVYGDEVYKGKELESDEKVLISWGWVAPAGRSEEEFQKECENALKMGGIRKAVPFDTPYPHYPYHSKKSKLKGFATYVAVFGIDGRVINLRIDKATDWHFSKVAFDAVQNWRMIPGVKDGRLVKTRIVQKIDFVPDTTDDTETPVKERGAENPSSNERDASAADPQEAK